ncbi:MAG: 7,8-didemethyl-8-hydroxy-5-deazariboflavin synthase subunit CofH [Halobacteria archaeon]|nr:7,8-didemethyl-8-hydroxy-5-deazariboflavin synthase subunit CofH [Halobacteria archaeon]
MSSSSLRDFDFEHVPENYGSSFGNALEKARNGERLSVDDGVQLITTGTDVEGIDEDRKEKVLGAADERRREIVGDEVTFVANINNNVTTACDTGCLFCNFKDPSEAFEVGNEGRGFTKTPDESREIVEDAVEMGVYEVCSVSGLHPAFALDDEHREILESSTDDGVRYVPTTEYTKSPGTYVEQIEAMDVGGVHVHSMTPEEAAHAKRGTDWSYEDVYTRLRDAGLDSAPGTAAEILVDEVREVICPNKIGTQGWIDAIEGAVSAGLGVTATIMYGHVENEAHRVLHLKRVRDLQDSTGGITEFVPLSFVHENTPLYERGFVESGASDDEDELLFAVSRLFLDNIDNIQTSWAKFGDQKALRMLDCGANDFMGTLLSEEITKRAGGDYGEFRSFDDYVEMIESIGRVPVERSTDYSEKRYFENGDDDGDGLPPYGPRLGPQADGTPLI